MELPASPLLLSVLFILSSRSFSFIPIVSDFSFLHKFTHTPLLQW